MPTVQIDDDHPGHDATVRSTITIERGDGATRELEWDDTGQVRSRQVAPDGTTTEELLTFDPDGAFVVRREPTRVEQERDLYGSLTERATYDDGTCVEHVWDSDVRLRRVRVEGAWGSQTMEIWPDGSRALRWNLAGLAGMRRWDATGASHSSVELPDATMSADPPR